jgi:hypothetical protein
MYISKEYELRKEYMEINRRGKVKKIKMMGRH